MDRKGIRLFLPAILIFIILNTFFLFQPGDLKSWGFDPNVLLIGNIFLFFVIAVSFLMGMKALHSRNTHAFFRMVYGSFLLKLFLIAAAAFAYIMIERKNVNKAGIIFCMGLYIIYTFIEVSALVKTARRKSNAQEGSPT